MPDDHRCRSCPGESIEYLREEQQTQRQYPITSEQNIEESGLLIVCCGYMLVTQFIGHEQKGNRHNGQGAGQKTDPSQCDQALSPGHFGMVGHAFDIPVDPPNTCDKIAQADHTPEHVEGIVLNEQVV